jgi:acetoin utilization protein AcuB
MPRDHPMLDLPAQSVMTLSPAAIGPEDSLADAAALMVRGGFRHLPIVDGDGRLTGILSERDLRARLGVEIERFPEVAPDVLEERVDGTMHANPIAVGPHTPLRDVVRALAEERVGAVPVLDEGDAVVGMISYVDVLDFLRAREPLLPIPEPAHGM